MKRKDLEHIAACIKKSCAESYNDGLRAGIASVERCLFWLQHNHELLEPHSMEKLAEFASAELKSLKSNIKEVGRT